MEQRPLVRRRPAAGRASAAVAVAMAVASAGVIVPSLPPLSPSLESASLPRPGIAVQVPQLATQALPVETNTISQMYFNKKWHSRR